MAAASEARDALRACVAQNNDKELYAFFEAWVAAVHRGEDVEGKCAALSDVCSLQLATKSADIRDAAARAVRVLCGSRAGRLPVLAGLEKDGALAAPPSEHQRLLRAAASVALLSHLTDATDAATALSPFQSSLLAELLKDDVVANSESAVRCLSTLVKTAQGRTMLCESSVMDGLGALIAQNDAVSIRVLEGLIAGVQRDEDGFAFLREKGILDALVDKVEESTTDLLLLLNYLEVLELLSQSPYGTSFLLTRRELGARLTALASQNLVESVSGFALRFIARFAAHSGENAAYAIDNKWVEVATGFADPHDASSTSLGAMDVVGSVGSTETGLAHLTDTGAWKILPAAAASRQPDMVEAALHALSLVFESTATSEGALARFTAALFAASGSDRLLAARSHAVTDVRTAGIRFILALARHEAAVPHLTGSQLMWDWFTDPDVEVDLECRALKYDAAVLLVKHAAAIPREAEEVMELRVVAKMGPQWQKRATRAPEGMIDS